MTIRAIGSYLPSTLVDNLPICVGFGRDEKFLAEKLGFLYRRRKADSETVSDMCVRACEDLQARRVFDMSRIGLLIVVTQNPEQKIPHAAAIVHQKLGLGRECMTFDMSQGCAGYVHGLSVAEALMAAHRIEHALLFTCDPYSDIVDPGDLATALIFGDAATATLLSRTGAGFRLDDAVFGTAPGSWGCLRCEDRFFMDGRQVLSNAVHEVPGAIRGLLDRNRLGAQDVAFYALHQASRHAIEQLRSELNIEPARAPFAAEHIGNTVSSSVPLLLQDRINACETGVVLACGFGVGFTWGAALLAPQSEGV